MRSPALRKSSAARAIAKLATGTAFAQLLGLLLTPIITRLYTPADYGTFALFNAVVAVVTSIAAGRYEAAVLLPPEDEQGERDAVALVRLALLISIISSLALLAGIVVLRAFGLVPWFDVLRGWAYAVPLAVLTSSASLTLMAYATRLRQYSRTALVAPMQKTVSSAVQIGLGRLGGTASGLIVGALVAPFVGLSVLSRVYREGAQRAGGGPVRESARSLRRVGRQYSDFPRINLWFFLLNTLSWNVQVLVLGRYFTASEVGQYALAMAALSAPSAILVNGVSQVYMRECAARAHDTEASVRLARKTVLSMAIVSIPPFVLVAFFGTQLFTLFFGADWALAGGIATAMIPLLWVRFFTTSLSSTFAVYRRQSLLLTWQVVSLTLTLATYSLGAGYGLGVVQITWLNSFVVAPLYLLLVPMAFRVIRAGPPSQVVDSGAEAGRPDAAD